MMKTFPFIFICVVVTVLHASVAEAQKPAPARGFDAFNLVQTRNIFDPQRYGSSAPVSQAAVPTGTPAGDYVALTGVLVTDQQTLAFFSGSRPDYEKVLAVDGEIAGAKLKKITPNGIVVDRNGHTVSINVGQTVPFDNSAPVAVPVAAPMVTPTATPVPATIPTPEAASVPVASPSPAPNALPPNLSDVMRRMMERRQQELK